MYFEDIKMGMTAQIQPAVIEKEKMIEFARTYDPIPLHTDEEFASKTHFGELIAPGVMSFMYRTAIGSIHNFKSTKFF